MIFRATMAYSVERLYNHRLVLRHQSHVSDKRDGEIHRQRTVLRARLFRGILLLQIPLKKALQSSALSPLCILS